jgi:hypothetical protein
MAKSKRQPEAEPTAGTPQPQPHTCPRTIRVRELAERDGITPAAAAEKYWKELPAAEQAGPGTDGPQEKPTQEE